MHPFLKIGGMSFPTYGICMAVGLLIAGALAFIRTKKFRKDVNSLIAIAACAIGFALVGAKLLYIITSYGFEKAMQEIKHGDFSCLSTSGLVFYGGLISGVAGAFIGAALAKEKLIDYIDIAVPCVPLGHAFGRIGCFMGGCCYGKPYDGIFSVTFPAVGVNHGVFPVQLLESLINIVICLFLIFFTRKSRGRFSSLFAYLLLYGISRFLLEMLRGDSIRGMLNGLSTSQWISILLIVVSLIFLILIRLSSAKRYETL